NNNPFDLFPVDAFVTKFAGDGTLVYSALVGGRNRDAGLAIKVDANIPPRAYIAGMTESSNFFGATTLGGSVFQATNAGHADAFVAMIDPSGTNVIYSTYIGGVADDQAQGLALNT